jgi:hypothetical protein
MPKHSQRFQSLSQQFEALVESLNDSPSLKERKQLLRRMKILIDEIDGLILSTLKRDGEDASSSPRSDRSTAGS